MTPNPQLLTFSQAARECELPIMKIDWTVGLPINRLFEDHELPLNKDARYAMSVSTTLLKTDLHGREVPLRARTGQRLLRNQHRHS